MSEKVKTIKAIETEFLGHLYRSRLEAKWAVFFKTLGIRYEYEPEGFEMGDGLRYLPDFRLPDHKCWVEIKGTKPTKKEQLKCKLLALKTKEPVLLFIGEPYFNCTWYEYKFLKHWLEPCHIEEMIKDHKEYPCFHGLHKTTTREGFVGTLNHPNCGTGELGEAEFDWYNYTKYPELIHDAYIAARQARFEHGKKG